jgi:exonuclease SbcD
LKFAHLSDIHLGFQKNESLQKIEQKVFEDILDECISRQVNFILIPGDMFHVNIPEMRVQKYAFAKFKQVHDAGIPVYVVYGSHDFSPISNSVIDLLSEIGYLKKVTIPKSNEDGTISLDFMIDQKTGVKIAGFPGLKVGRDREYYEKLDRSNFEDESGFKIFLFHGGIADMKTESGMDGDHMPLSLLPKGFHYYAGGHMHKFNHQTFDDYPHVVYPGTPFAGFHIDLEENAKGFKRGYVLVDFDSKVNSVEFIAKENTQYEIIEVDAHNRKPESVNAELNEKTREIDVSNKVVIIKVQGELMSGKTSDVDLSSIKDRMSESGSLVVNISRNQLTSKEFSITEAKGSNKDEVETNVFAENIGQFGHLEQKNLVGNEGVELAKKLLRELGQQSLLNEKKNEYIPRIKQNALGILGVDEDDS